jgi:hypothetical protein
VCIAAETLHVACLSGFIFVLHRTSIHECCNFNTFDV